MARNKSEKPTPTLKLVEDNELVAGAAMGVIAGVLCVGFGATKIIPTVMESCGTLAKDGHIRKGFARGMRRLLEASVKEDGEKQQREEEHDLSGADSARAG